MCVCVDACYIFKNTRSIKRAPTKVSAKKHTQSDTFCRLQMKMKLRI